MYDVYYNVIFKNCWNVTLVLFGLSKYCYIPELNMPELNMPIHDSEFEVLRRCKSAPL